jgi:hypothetical protein
MAVVDVT